MMGLGAKAFESALLLNKPQWELVQQQEGESWLHTRHRSQVYTLQPHCNNQELI